MLSWNDTLSYCKSGLSLPSTFIEEEDDKLKEYLINTALREFSQFYPGWGRTAVIVNNPIHQVDGKTNWFYFFDDENLPIIGIREVYFDLADEAWSGMPMVGPFSMDGMLPWSIQQLESRFYKKYSDFSQIVHYYEPNIVEVLTSSSFLFKNNFIVEYEKMQSKDLSTIPESMSMIFMDLALGHLMIKYGRMRSHYGSRINTPFGEIPLDGEFLLTEGKEIRREIVEKLENNALPSVIIDMF